MTIKERILLFLKIEKIKKSNFFTDTGIASSNFKGAGMNSELGSDKIVKILTTYPNLSSDWLLLGNEPMFRIKEENKTRQEITYPNESILYKMYKEEKEETARLNEQIGILKERIRQMETGNFIREKKHSGVFSPIFQEQSQPAARVVRSTTKSARKK